MRLSLSSILSASKNILCTERLAEMMKTVTVRSFSFDRKNRDITLRTNSFKKKDTETTLKYDGSDKVINEDNSISFKKSNSKKPKLNTTFSFKNLILDHENIPSYTPRRKETSKPTISLPERAILFSPRPVSELDAAAVKLQKVYKSYRTRRNLADCAVVVEELWWKALDFAALEQSSVSFFDIDKQETAVSRWARAKKRVAKVGKGLSKDENARKLALQHWLEAIDPRHRYGHNLHVYYDIWFESESTQPFFYWLDIGDGKEINLEKCPRNDLQRQCIKYLGPKERETYEVIVESGKLVYRHSGILVNTAGRSKWIFVLSTTRSLYVGQKKKGVFQHSSFLSGGATTAAGRLVAHDGVLEAIWPYSGHYLPTEENFKEFIAFLEENHVDLTDVKRCATDDDDPSSVQSIKEDTKPKAVDEADEINKPMEVIAVTSDHGDNMTTKVPAFEFSKPLSCKWSTGTGPRIGCVRDYSPELQSRALEQVNLSPRVTPGAYRNNCPIPSPRPSPKIRLSPRLAYMGLPSPRVSIPAAN